METDECSNNDDVYYLYDMMTINAGLILALVLVVVGALITAVAQIVVVLIFCL